MKETTTTNRNKQLLKTLLVHGRRPLLVSTGMGLLGTLCFILQTFAFARSVQLVVVERAGLGAVVPWLLIFGGIIGIRALCTYLAGWLSARGALRIQQQARRTMLDVLFAADSSLPKLGEPQTAETVHTLLEQVDALEPYYARYIPQLWLTILTPAVLLLVVIPINWLVGLILMLATPIIPFYMALIGMEAEAKSRQHIEMLRLLSATFLDYLQGIPTLKALGSTGRASRQIAEASHELGRRSMHVQRIAFLSSAVLEFFSTFAIAIIATYIGLTLLNYLQIGAGLANMSLQTGLFLLLLAPAYFQPLRVFAAAYHDRANALAAVEHLVPFLASGRDARKRNEIKNNIHDVERIEFQDVTLHYPGRTIPTFQELHFSMRAGQKIALVGPSGSGKSSLLSLVSGHTQPTSGKVLVNGRALDETTRIQISWIGQRPYLFPGTLAENIALGQPERSREEIEQAAYRAGVMQFAGKLPAGLNTKIGERGSGLSGGEAQRIALARAFLKNAPLLILDEPTAHLDTTTEAELIETMETLMADRTVLLATHSPALLTLCNRVLHIDNGTITEEQEIRKKASYA